MPEQTKSSDVRTIALRVSPDYHAQLALVAQVDEITLTDLIWHPGYVRAAPRADSSQRLSGLVLAGRPVGTQSDAHPRVVTAGVARSAPDRGLRP